MSDLVTSVLQMEKRCIFCGDKPTDKNREHVIPRWLISLTGDPRRDWYLGIQTNKPGRPERRFSADQFTFPACESCNTRYSALEARAKGYVEKLLADVILPAREWDDLMDWFDKVRIGLWIGNIILNKDWPIPNPGFYIDQRVAKKDRFLLVYENAEPDYVGLNMTGASDPVFFHFPSVFMLVINRLVFINASYEFLLTARMGFPYPKKMWFEERVEGTRRHVDDFTATYRPRPPFLRFSFYPPKFSAHQTILIESALDGEDYGPLIAHEYVSRKRLPHEKIKTRICAVDNDKARFLDPDDLLEEINQPKPMVVDLKQHYIRLFEFRNRLLTQSLEEQPAARKIIRMLIGYNDGGLAQAKAGIGSNVGLQPTRPAK
ncbi:hypothetical protein [Neorhizobium galegae]|uniref:hypothetical protein n=1 Tax=Neorhizobium galegae TaxID=399 RepID=UPI00062245C5|nr:hypothetical protein [Neorhizobium galegae]MCQ1810643.1 hypothetical protein [Neorhizobium galegae]CDZ64779.1 Hypothetical protein NGAL_HAMBI2566_62090 [Neorhizobium galegae bv. orientalis]